MWVRIKGKWRQRIVSELVKEPRVTVFTPPNELASYIHFEHATMRQAFIVWLVDHNVAYSISKNPPLD